MPSKGAKKAQKQQQGKKNVNKAAAKGNVSKILKIITAPIIIHWG